MSQHESFNSASQSIRRTPEPYFDVIVHDENIKTIAAALHLLQKIGREVTLEIEDRTLTLRALNDTKSAFAAVELSADQIFSRFHLAPHLDTFSCKVNIKPICVIFRNTKNLRNIRIYAAPGMADSQGEISIDHELVFEMLLQSDITRTYRFRYHGDCEIMNAVFDEEEAGCSCLRARPKIFSQLLLHIHQSASPEVCINASSEGFEVRSFHSSNPLLSAGRSTSNGISKPQVNTGLAVSLTEFENYEYRAPEIVQSMVFGVKEVNSFLGYCEVVEMPEFDFFFTESGRAVKFVARQTGCGFISSLVLATIEPPQQHRQDQGTERPQSEYHHNEAGQTSSAEQNMRTNTSVEISPTSIAYPNNVNNGIAGQNYPPSTFERDGSDAPIWSSPRTFLKNRNVELNNDRESDPPSRAFDLQADTSQSNNVNSNLDSGIKPVVPNHHQQHCDDPFLQRAKEGTMKRRRMILDNDDD